MTNALSMSLASLAISSAEVEAKPLLGLRKEKIVLEVSSWETMPIVDLSLAGNQGGVFESGIIGFYLIAKTMSGQEVDLFLKFPNTKIEGRTITIVNDKTKLVLNFNDVETAQEYYGNIDKLPTPEQYIQFQLLLDQYREQYGKGDVRTR